MAPVKFDDLSKVAKGILSDDYAKKYANEFKAKQKVDSIGAVVTTTVAIDPKGGKDVVSTPATVSLKLPKPFGVGGVTIDKLEYNKSGDWKLETSFDKGLHTIDGLTADVKSDLVDVTKISTGVTFTGIADTQLKLETKPSSGSFTFEATRSQGPATLGVKLTEKTYASPDIGLRVSHSGIFGSLVVTDAFKTIDVHAHYKATPVLDLAVNAKQTAKGMTAAGGVAFKVNDSTTVKVKTDNKGAVESVVKYTPSKGFSIFKYGKFAGGAFDYGFAVNIE